MLYPFALEWFGKTTQKCVQIASSILFDVTRFSDKSIEQNILSLQMSEETAQKFKWQAGAKQLFKLVRKLTFKSALMF